MKDSCMLFEIQNTCGQRITHDYYNYRVHSLLYFDNNHTIFLPRIQVFLKPCIVNPQTPTIRGIFPYIHQIVETMVIMKYLLSASKEMRVIEFLRTRKTNFSLI